MAVQVIGNSGKLPLLGTELLAKRKLLIDYMAGKESGGQILGFRDLAIDGIEPSLFRDAWSATCVQRGFDLLRPFDRKKDAELPVFSTWGFGVIKILAEKHLGDAAGWSS